MIYRGLPDFWYGAQTLESEKPPLCFGVDNRLGLRTSDPQADLHIQGEGAMRPSSSAPDKGYASLRLESEGHPPSELAGTSTSMVMSTETGMLYLGAGEKIAHVLTDPDNASGLTLDERRLLTADDAGISALRPLNVEGGADVQGVVTVTVTANGNDWVRVDVTCSSDSSAMVRLLPEGKANSGVSAGGALDECADRNEIALHRRAGRGLSHRHGRGRRTKPLGPYGAVLDGLRGAGAHRPQRQGRP
ncbi:hypothetical protein Salmuc_01008 [Salipiger mucosus DSM 16094]|uniref:Uncharacterized protein n=1 Tax=Salipiger mucosus DSM 16094 TaxID=1123237 RepID=S9RCP8_9RHOB|nr:hypothetical protein Salmuc_01008 [Salipiger mucosus DSM 16094]